jgi:hypothetical protein
MATILDIFNNRQFSAAELTQAINVVPNTYGRVNELGVFRDEPIATTTVAVEFNNGVLNLLPTRERGGPPSYGMAEKRNMRAFVIPHIPHEDFVTAGEVQNLIGLAGGVGALALEGVEAVVNRKLARMRAKHAITLEHMRMGSLKGQLLDYDGSVIYNWFTEFGVTEKVINFPFSVTTTDVPGIITSMLRWIEDNLLGEVSDGVRVFCSPEWFDALVAHSSVKDAYRYFARAQDPVLGDVRRGFEVRGAVFEEYRGSATQMNEDKTTTVRKFIPTNEARAFPENTQDTFVNYWAPADFIETVNVLGQQIYVKQAIDQEFQRYVKIHTQSNPLAICQRPATLVRLTMS